MTIVTHIEARIERLPLAQPVRIAGRTIAWRDWLVVATAADIHHGYGFVFAGYEGGYELARFINATLAPMMIGAVLEGRPALSAAIHAAAHSSGHSNSMRAVSAIDIACWDLMARKAGRSLADFIGRVPAPVQSTYVGSGYYLGDIMTDATAVAAVAATGAPAIKVKVGASGLDTDLARVTAFREAIGPETELIIDANGAWTSLSMAIEAIRALRPFNISYFEDPMPPDRLADYRALRLQTGERVSAGETYASVEEFARALDAQAIDIAQVDATACGGVGAFIDIAALCSNATIPLETHWFPELHSQLAQTTSACRRIEIFLDDEIVNFRKLMRGPASEHAGHGINLAHLFAKAPPAHSLSTNQAEQP